MTAQWFDTHCHLDVQDEAGLRTARTSGVGHFVVPATAGISGRARSLASKNSDVHCLAGWHPLFLDSWSEDSPSWLASILSEDSRLIGIGEIGLDRPTTPRTRPRPPVDEQEPAFARQLEVASDIGCPVVIHLRGAFERFLSHVRRHPETVYVMHSFSGSAEFATRLLRELPEVYFAFGGVAARPEARRVHAALRAVPWERLLVETDAPDADLPSIGERIAALRGTNADELARVTWNNARRAFRWRIDSTG